MRCLEHPDTIMEVTDWQPPTGFDPSLRQFRCPKCQREDYKVPTAGERFQLNDSDPLRVKTPEHDRLL